MLNITYKNQVKQVPVGTKLIDFLDETDGRAFDAHVLYVDAAAVSHGDAARARKPQGYDHVRCALVRC